MPHFVLAFYYHTVNTGDRHFLAEVWPVLNRVMEYVLRSPAVGVGMGMAAAGVATTPCASGLPHADVRSASSSCDSDRDSISLPFSAGIQ